MTLNYKTSQYLKSSLDMNARDLILPILLIGVILAMMVPLPPWGMDILLVANLTCAMGLLVSAVCITDSLKLSALPTILLVSTLVRLALNVSSTRLILLHGEAGQVIEAFGKVVLQGNVLVGVILFLVISLIQFLVVAKGAERVAEVSARFTLDALPGKQMSIDADVRAGLIDFSTARKKRNELQIESRFYGALDGAMKFVKGDAIAGLVIIAVNIFGGFIGGIVGSGLTLHEALVKYTVLSVGDGLVAQIPALLNAVAAGLVVTRVARDEVSSLGGELVTQILPNRGVSVILSVFCFAIGALPAMPFLPGALFGVILLASACIKKSADRREEASEKNESKIFEPKLPPPLRIQSTRAHLQKISIAGVQRISENLRKIIFERWGILLAPIDVQVVEKDGAPEILVRGDRAMELSEEMTEEELVHHLEEVIEERISEFVDDLLIRRTLDAYEPYGEELITSAVPGAISTTQLTAIVRTLVTEGISVRNFDLVLQSIAETKGKGFTERGILEEVRVGLKRTITSRYLRDEGKIYAYLFTPYLDLLFIKAEREGMLIEGCIIDNVINELCDYTSKPNAQGEVMLVAKGARRLVSDILKARRITLPVLSFEELQEDCEIEVCGRIEGGAHGIEEIEQLAA